VVGTWSQVPAPGQHKPPGDDRRHSQRDTSIEVLLEYERGKKRGKDTFHVQQEGSGAGVGWRTCKPCAIRVAHRRDYL